MLKISPEVKKLWVRIKSAWNTNEVKFRNTLSYLTNEQANSIYDVVRLSLFKNSYVNVLRDHPELKDLLKNDNDRLCMYNVYSNLSVRLNRREDPPNDVKLAMNLKGNIGRKYTFGKKT
ncbi:MAG: hypothetical protein ABH842_02035 [Candidatus Micrarchaeota archaeon]